MKNYFKVLLETSEKDNAMFSGALEQFHFDCKVKNLSEKTLDVYGERLTNFYNFLKVKNISFDDVDKSAIQDYILSMKDKVSDHTVNGRIRVLKTFFKFLVNDGLWNGRPNPMEKISFMKVDKKIKPVLSIEQVEQLPKVPNKKTFTGFRNFCIIHLFWDSLIRLGELLNIRVGDIDFKNGSLKIYGGKSRKERILPLGARVIKNLHQYWIRDRQKIEGEYFFCQRNGKPLNRRNVQRILERIGEKVGIHVSPHLLRHSAASYLALSGIPAFMLQSLLGHSTLNTTQMYIHLVDDEKIRKVFMRYSPGDAIFGRRT